MASLLERDNELLKRKSTALELKKRKQGGIGGVGGTAVAGNLANNKQLRNIYQATPPTEPTGITAPTTAASLANNLELRQSRALREAPVTRPATTYNPVQSIEEQANDQFLQAVLQERRNQSPGEANRQGAFLGDTTTPVQAGRGTLSVVGQDADTAAANNAFLQQYRAEQANKIAGVRQAERIGAIQKQATDRRAAQREAIESMLFQSGIGRYRANAERDAQILGELAPFLSGESDVISEDLQAALGAETAISRDRASTAQGLAAAQADIAETQRQALADQFAEQRAIRKEERELESDLFGQDEALAAADLAERKFAFGQQKDKAEAEARAARLQLDAAKFERQRGRDIVKDETSARSLITQAAEGAPGALPSVLSNQLGRIQGKEAKKNLLAQLQLQKLLKPAEVDLLAKQFNLLPEEVKGE